MIVLKKATSKQAFEIGKVLFREYAEGLGIDLDFQNFDQELEDIHKQYSEPEGILVIVYAEDGQPIGCFGIRKLSEGICELKRMYLKNHFRGNGIGQQMMEAAIKMGDELGYTKIRLDTLVSMKPAIALYEKHGFYEIPSYRFNPIDGAIYFEKELANDQINDE